MSGAASPRRGKIAATGLVPNNRAPTAGRGHRRRRVGEAEADHDLALGQPAAGDRSMTPAVMTAW